MSSQASTHLHIKLVHFNMPALGAAWAQLFANQPAVEVLAANILEVPADAIVSPGNSFGFMDGGLDRAISQHFGWDVQAQLRKRIAARPVGELLVGETEIIEASGQLVVCAPTMRVPSRKGVAHSVNAYLAMKGILIAAQAHQQIHSIAIPGLCTGTGNMPPQLAARQMFAAYDEIINGNRPEFPLFTDAVKHQTRLTQ